MTDALSEALRVASADMEKLIAQAAVSPGTVRAHQIASIRERLDGVAAEMGAAQQPAQERQRQAIARYRLLLEQLRAAVLTIQTALTVERNRLQGAFQHLRNAAACASAYRR